MNICGQKLEMKNEAKKANIHVFINIEHGLAKCSPQAGSKVLLENSHVHLFMPCHSLCHIRRAEMSSCKRDIMPHKYKIFTM